MKYTKEMIAKLSEMEAENNNLRNKIAELELVINKPKKPGRKQQVLGLLTEFGPIEIIEMANKLDISTANVSSQLAYLKADGIDIRTMGKGLKYIEKITD